MPKYRNEVDSLGTVRVPNKAYYGAQTKRAIDNFPVSGQPMPLRFIHALALVKKSACHANEDLGLIETEMAEWMQQAAQEVIDGDWDEHFPIDVFQTGSGTSTNMNANEVIGNRASELMGGELGARHPVHPNDHVNMSQSSNDVIPTALHLAGAMALHQDLLPALKSLHKELAAKAEEWDRIVLSGRTHLMDATPIRLGQVFSGYAAQIEKGIQRAEAAMQPLLELALGGTAVGTGLNCPEGFADLAIRRIVEETLLDFHRAENPFEAQSARDAVVEVSGQLKVIAVSLSKIANDIRMMASGPRAGLGELILPAVQPGSSIMPGKVNPVHCEMVVMVAAQVMGNDVAITHGGAGGQLQLNAMLPLLAHNLLNSVELLSGAARTFGVRCVRALKANEAQCQATLERNLSMGTALAPVLGYDAAAELAKRAYAQGTSVREQALADGVLPADELDRLLDPISLTGA